jgi:hypothetical protein
MGTGVTSRRDFLSGVQWVGSSSISRVCTAKPHKNFHNFRRRLACRDHRVAEHDSNWAPDVDLARLYCIATQATNERGVTGPRAGSDLTSQAIMIDHDRMQGRG